MTAQKNLREAHAHIYSLAESLEMTDLSSCPDLDSCLEFVARAADRARAATGFARLHAARVEAWPQRRWPTLQELDRASGDTPVVILSFDHHAACANTAALRAAGLTPGQVVPPNGLVCVDDRTNPTGLLIEHAAYRAWEAVPLPDEPARAKMLAAALRHLATLGFTEVHDLHTQPWLGRALAALDRSGELDAVGIRDIWLYPPVADAALTASTRASWTTPHIRLAGFKVFLDGTLNSRTAWMLEPYTDPTPGLPNGKPMMSLPDLADAMNTARDAGVGLAVHAIGDAAVRTALDTWERHRGTEAQRHQGPASASPFVPSSLCASVPALRIEHCELIHPADVPRFAQLGVVCSVQPCHLLADVEALTRYLPDRLERVLPLRDLIAAGCTPDDLLWFGSDVPIVRADPADSIRAATQRRRADMPQRAAIAWDQRIGDSQAWRAFARSGA